MGTRKSQSAEECNGNPTPEINDDQTPKMSLYEKSREERIKSNFERMQKLGLFDLSQKLNSSAAPKRTQRNNPSPAKRPSPLKSPGPLRRSSRLHNATPVSYSEAVLAKKDGLLEDEDVRLEVGSKPEVYTEEHEKLLGSTDRSWTFFVDGYGKDGKRIYDQVKGKTCHQCRQKTLGYRTHCSKCKMVQGQFCGDCLYMRYGEHVLEAIENPNWICPPCRGICNCSFCRQAKGWAPTGPLYKKISRLGYKSVAHYLIQTRRSQNTVEKELVTANQVSVKRYLPFSEMEKPSKITNEEIRPLMPEYEETIHDELKTTTEPNSKILASNCQTKRSLPFSGSEERYDNMESVEVNNEEHYHPGLPESMFRDERESGLKIEKREQPSYSGNLLVPDGEAVPEKMVSTKTNEEVYVDFGLSMPIFEGKRENELKSEEAMQLQSTEHDTILESLRLGQLKTNDHLDSELSGINEKNSDVKQSINNYLLSNQEVKKEKEMHVGDGKIADSTSKVESCAKLKKKTAATEPNLDSIGGRLRQRRRVNKGYDGELSMANVQNIQI
ncbi:hypothetical protein JCGZ_12314 [Jatropha curcas]|uniref:Zinc-finger domain-containing protein n=1 Tax=Jatropha curcas TaxID=180498 RepID=A0A067KA46_JATCU|nr:uncharacterized protein LOC105639638 [Jatropha curcas]KDP31853.1 hypothetical protein JCGZ_12314 [Jatropha curcas]